MPVLLTQAQFAERHGVSKPTVTAWKAKGLLVFAPDPAKPAKHLVDAEKSDLLVRASIDPTRGRPRAADRVQADVTSEELEPQGHGGALLRRHAAPGLSGIEEARLEEMRERTRRRKIETEQLLATLVPAAEYERRAGEMGRKCREGVAAVVRQLAERVAAETDPRQVIAVLGEGFDELFNRLADEIEADAQAERQVDAELAPLAEDDELDDAEAAA